MDKGDEMNSSGFRLNEADIEEFQRDGAVCLRQVFGPDEVAAMQAGVTNAMASPGPHARDFGNGKDGRFFGDVFVWTRQPELERIVVRSRLGAISGALMGSSTSRFFFDHMLVKEAGTDAPTPWHQDAPYFPIRGMDCVSIWIALDHVSRDTGAVEYVKGSHRTGKIYAPESFHADYRLENDSLERLPDIDAKRDEFDLVSWELAPGDCVVHHVRTIHGAPGNSSKVSSRRAIATRWIGDDIVYETRPGIPEPMTMSMQDLAPALVEGQAYNGDVFPLIWSRDDRASAAE